MEEIMKEDKRSVSLVRRITIDEKLADDTIRILISTLDTDKTEIDLSDNVWSKEEEFMIGPANYDREMGMSDPNKYPWEHLKEGQVYLSGNFTPILNEETLKQLQIGKKEGNFLRVDEYLKDGIKELYSKAIRGGK